MIHQDSAASRVDADSIVDTIRAMRKREGDYVIGDYLSSNQTTALPQHCPMDLECRSVMCQWCISIVDHVGFHRSLVAIAMNLLDRFLAVSPWAVKDRSAFQLASITCLYTAAKVHAPQAISIESMAALSRGAFSVEQIRSMEGRILQAIRWLANPPTTFIFCQYYCQLISTVDARYDFQTISELTKIQLEQALKDYKLSLMPPSTVAFASVMNALEVTSLTSSDEKTRMGCFLADMANIDSSPAMMRNVRDCLYATLMDGDGVSATNPAKRGRINPAQQSSRPVSPRCVSTMARPVTPTE